MRVFIFLSAVVLAIAVAFVGYQAVQTLNILDEVERERDRWQQPGAVMKALDLKPGGVVADLGSGAGYFTLKLAPIVGAKGAVLAVDVRRESLVFLWIRAHLRGESNIQVIRADAQAWRSPAGPVDAVLVANTYHEFTHPRAVLDRVFENLRSGGRLVVLDRGPLPEDESEAQQHERDPSAVERELRESGFKVTERNDRFIDQPAAERPGDRPDDHTWWLIVAAKP